MKRILTDTQMKFCDNRAISLGEKSSVLMYRAANAVFESYNWDDNKIYVICGKGNNGGDGYALAYILKSKDYHVEVFEIGQFSSDAAIYREQAIISGVKVRDIEECGYECDILVDCIFGIGFKGEVKDCYAKVIDDINKCDAVKISVDIPSGLDSNSGIAKKAVKADITVAIQCAKTGHYLNDGKDYCGKLIVKDIGIDICDVGFIQADESIIASVFKKRRFNTNKSTFGKAVMIGGCINYCGAMKLSSAALCAMRAGCGLTTLAVPSNILDYVAPSIVESTLYPLDSDNGGIVFNDKQANAALSNADVVIIGMGIGGNKAEILKYLRYIAAIDGVKLIIDADGLNALSEDVELLAGHKAEILLTPHPKEMSRLCNVDISQVLDNPIYIARDFAVKYGVCVLLKGASTIVTDGKEEYIITNGGAFLSKGGNGDVLSGVIGGIAAQSNSLALSAACASYICAKCGEELVDEFGEQGVMPSDIAINISKTVKQILN